MLHDEIEQLKKRLDTAIKEGRDTKKSDEFMANLADTNGWEILKTRIETRINLLLEPGTSATADLATIGAVTMARELAIAELRRVVSDVESTKKALVEIKKGSPEPVAE